VNISKTISINKKAKYKTLDAIPKILKRGEGIPNYDIIFNEDKSLTVGCQQLTSKQVKNTFKFLTKHLKYDLEE